MLLLTVSLAVATMVCIIETVILAGNNWVTTKYTPVYRFIVNSFHIGSLCSAFWWNLMIYNVCIVTPVVYIAGCYSIVEVMFFDIGTVNQYGKLATIVTLSMLFATITIVWAKATELIVRKRYDRDEVDPTSRKSKIMTSFKNIYSKFKDKYCPIIK